MAKFQYLKKKSDKRSHIGNQIKSSFGTSHNFSVLSYTKA